MNSKHCTVLNRRTLASMILPSFLQVYQNFFFLFYFLSMINENENEKKKNQRDFRENQRYFDLWILGNRFEDIQLGEILGDLEIQGLGNQTFGVNLNWEK
ncbi:hypothetical protein V6Z12_A10G137600 [Gossypium hirsutum]